MHNEADNLRRLADALASQTVPASSWVIVDNGSTDKTPDIAKALMESLEWVKAMSIPGEDHPMPGAPIVRAFHAGLAAIAKEPDIIVKLDADTSMEPNHFERLLAAFADDPLLGIASGTCLELDASNSWVPVAVAEGHVRGAVRAYRWKCLEQLLPLEERVGWDGIDELKASVLGWRTEMLDELCFHHHRSLGARDGASTARWRAQGEASYFMGYRFSYLVLRTLHRARRNPAAFAMLASYIRAMARRDPRYGDAKVRAHLRSRQTLRHLAKSYRKSRSRGVTATR